MDSLISDSSPAPPPDLEDQSGARSRWWALPLRLLISAALLAFLAVRIQDFETAELLPEWSSDNGRWLALAAALTFAAFGLAALRWQQVLASLDRPARLSRLISHTFAGQVISNVLPTTIGGDVLRVRRLARDNGDPHTSFASVILERLTGWIVLPLFTIVGLGVNSGFRGLGWPTRLAGLTAVVTLVILAGIFVLGANETLGRRLVHGQGWRRSLTAIHLGIVRIRNRRTAPITILSAGAAYQGMLILAAFCAAQALDIDEAGLTFMLAFFPAVLILQVLPIGIGGLGIRETTLVIFLSPLGVADERAIAFGLTLHLLTLTVSLVGVPQLALGGRGGKR
ncbi:MAG: flippase-like domain-containing protein [Actinomycetia bacterium]|nr:flippase-like domain-containing protein [Actinomycetes bacterium]MCP4084329.1 flippase-like domain-containing protein [Actinomycetes bacterium]